MVYMIGAKQWRILFRLFNVTEQRESKRSNCFFFGIVLNSLHTKLDVNFIFLQSVLLTS